LVLIALFAIQKSVKNYQELNKNITLTKKEIASPHNYSTNDARFKEADHAMSDAYEPQHIQNRQHRAPSAPNDYEVEMQPPPPQQQQQPYLANQMFVYSPNAQIMHQQPYIQAPYPAASSTHSHQAYGQYPQQQQSVYSASAQYAQQQNPGGGPQYGGYAMSDRV